MNWDRIAEHGWGLFKGLSNHTRIADPDRKIDRSPKTRKFTPQEKAKLMTKLELKRKEDDALSKTRIRS